MPQSAQEEQATLEYTSWQSSIARYKQMGAVITAGDLNAWLGPAASADEEPFVGTFGEKERNHNGKLLARLLVRTGMVSLR